MRLVCMLASYPGHVGGLGMRLVCMYVCMYVSLVPRLRGRPGYKASMYVCMYCMFVVCMHVSLVPRPCERPGYEASMYVCMYVCMKALVLCLSCYTVFEGEFHQG